MKLFVRGFAIVCSLFIASQAQAQMMGLPIGNSTGPMEPGTLTTKAIGMIGSDSVEHLFGVRGQYGLGESFYVSLDLGGVAMEDLDDTFAAQLGGQLNLYMSDTVDTGLRLSGYMMGEDTTFVNGQAYKADATGLNLSFVAGGDSGFFPGVDLYGAIGIDYLDLGASGPGAAFVEAPEETTVLIAGGLGGALNSWVDGFLEFAYRDGFLVGVGVSMDF